MELQLEELEADAGEDELTAEMVARRSTVRAFERRRSSRKPFSEHLPRERVVIAAPTNCACCEWAKLSKLGKDVTETLEVIPRQWKVIQTETLERKARCGNHRMLTPYAFFLEMDPFSTSRVTPLYTCYFSSQELSNIITTTL